MPDLSLRERLRGATAERHAALDTLVSAWRIDTPEGYGAFLTASAAAVAPLELALEAAGVATWLPDWPRRIRRFALWDDLAALGLSRPPRRSAQVRSRGFGAGLLYTLEGSRLGGRVLARRVRAAHDWLPVTYLNHGHGDDSWRTFLAWLDGSNVGRRTDEIEAGARYGFQYFSDAFESRAAVGAGQEP